MQRRSILKLMLLACLVPLRSWASTWNKSAFESTKLDQTLKNLGVSESKASSAIDIIVADRAENGAVVQIEVLCNIPNTESIAILIAGNPTPLIANFILQHGAPAHVVTRVKMAQSSDVMALIKADGVFYQHKKNVVVLEDGCSGSDSDSAFQSSIKMRAKLQDKLTEVKAIIVHPMTTGRSKNSAGEIVPAHFIQNINVSLNNHIVFEMQCSTAISKNPYLTFYLAGLKLDDKLVLTWQDNQGLTGQGETTVIQG
jgi:thiosulfate oxidation carrier complex protein SoxZ